MKLSLKISIGLLAALSFGVVYTSLNGKEDISAVVQTTEQINDVGN
ncbi:MAG: hypothetical protein ACI9SD_001867 [Pseudohongiellaceae bacterium]|jgi:hypothetical protein